MNDGGPAFPLYAPDTHNHDEMVRRGMSLRDWFAGRALSGILALEEDPEAIIPFGIAVAAYKIADAMLKAREVNHVE